ncbi:alpha/beta fold hydrolase [Paucibacter sp. R3-3]|uniref:Alpha/beta fold hydrolase n=1 Tax=Roseateles agri TaxID=3098619 RepID=A0ABU5DB91_9BURK|nr:alpha/beta fold hydrolase [Paucibacter sp. R3-3]MDY0743524.1 alpha/beta fold hydrolase [Paucibacter sp. R3-3]
MQISANGITLEVEDHGPVSGEPLLLIMGLGMQLIAWPEGFVQQLVRAGFRVIRFDNRDMGLSQRFDHLGRPNVGMAAFQHLLHLPVQAPYTLADMANDAAGVLQALGISSAHVCGASMGGMIAQHLALDHPALVKSLTLMMTSSGARGLPQPSIKVGAAMMSKPSDPKQVDSVAAYYVKLFRLIGSPGYPTPEPQLRAQIEASIRRGGFANRGTARQLVAVGADGASRAERLGGIAVPTRVIHGEADPLVPVAHGDDLARRIRGATLDRVPGMGHDLPEPLWPRFAEGIRQVSGR